MNPALQRRLAARMETPARFYGTVAAVIAGFAVLVTVAALVASWKVTGAVQSPQVAPSPTATLADARSDDKAACYATAVAFTNALTDKKAPADRWSSAVAAHLTPVLANTISTVPRDRIPAGPAGAATVTAQPGSCDAVVPVAAGRAVAVQAQLETGRWRVTRWEAQ